MKEYINEISAFIIGLSPTIYNMVNSNNNKRKDEIQILTENYKDLYTAIKKSEEDCQEKYKLLLEELTELKGKLYILENKF
jgi:hypothetical protein